MRRVSAYLLMLLGATLGALAPAAAYADSLNPVGYNAWDFYVYGNGSAIAQILTALKLLLAPQGGGGGFRTLLLAVAMIGFLALAIRAGFDPAKNFLKMFGFIFLIAVVMYGTETATVNVTVTDQLTGYINTVPGVPAIVGLPASLISEAGYWLTNEIEQDFSTPSSMKVSTGGQFDMFGKVLSDMNQMVITDPDLKRSLSAYVSDCVVPNMALGNVTADELLNSSDLFSVLGQAQNKALLTRYYPMSGSTNSCSGLSSAAAASQLGDLMSCTQAYSCLKGDLTSYASELLHATDQQWQTTGIMVPFETAMTDALAEASSAGSGTAISGNSSPNGLILQTALENSLRGSFRNAAARMGNNSLMLSTAIAQADQSQKTSWFTAAQIFKNLMGYVYIVLQAFVIGVIPVVVIALMIPGLGGKVFLNYIEVLVWLTLWSPIMAILNFLITVLGGSEMHQALSGGLTLGNSAVVSEYTNNLVIAAQFLGTMIPLLTWGLVKGSLAFTEFITHGIGSSFATQAGAQASTGNVSMNNDSMNNVGMDKYNTSMSADVGLQETGAAYGGGHALNETQRGGSYSTQDGVSNTKTISTSNSVSVTNDAGWSTTMNKGMASQFVKSRVDAASKAKQLSESLQNMRNSLISQVHQQEARHQLVNQQTIDALHSVSRAQQAVAQTAFKTAVGANSDITDLGVEASVEVTGSLSHAEQLTHDAKQAYSNAQNENRTYAEGDGSSTQASHAEMVANQAATSDALSSVDSSGTQMSKSVSEADNFTKGLKVSAGASEDIRTQSGILDTGGSVGDVQGVIASARRTLGTDGSSLVKASSALKSEYSGMGTHVKDVRSEVSAAYTSASHGMKSPSARPLVGPSATVKGVKTALADAKAGAGSIHVNVVHANPGTS